MALDLCNEEETFGDGVNECCDILEGEMSLDLLDILYPDPGGGGRRPSV